MAVVDAAIADRELPPYFAVSLLKLALMSICTFGIYELWWFYKNWCRIKQREESDISPAWRAVFAPIWAYACFARLRTTARTISVPVILPAGPLAIIWIISANLWRLPHPFSLLCMFSFVWLFPAQIAANRINSVEMPEHDPNVTFGKWEIAILVLGSICFLLATIGEFSPA
jgi:hypothetical protein